jgi:hypothetical protein
MKLKLSAVNRVALTPGSLIVFVAWVYLLISSEALPDPVAVHWGITGQADGFIERESYLQVVAPALLIPWGLQVTFFVLKRRSPIIRDFIAGILSIVYWLLFLILFFATTTQLSESTASQSTYPLGLLGALFVLIPLALWFTLANPSIELGKSLVVRLRGIKVLVIPMDAVLAVETTQLSPWNYGGLGIRVSGNTLAFVPSKGEGVVFSLESGEKIAVRSETAGVVIARAQEVIAS